MGTMRRLVVLLSFAAGLGALGLLACGGGNDKPPLTPDTVEPANPEAAEAGAPPATPPTK